MTVLARSLPIVLLALTALQPRALAAQGPRITAALIDTAGRRLGEVTASEDAGGAILQVHARGFSPGMHGMHLHADPRCEPPSFQTAEGHLNPGQRKHGRRSPAGPHTGDLPNLLIGADSVGRVQVRIDGYFLRAGDRSIGAPGVALVIHALPDDESTDPSGASGARLACALITVAAGD